MMAGKRKRETPFSRWRLEEDIAILQLCHDHPDVEFATIAAFYLDESQSTRSEHAITMHVEDLVTIAAWSKPHRELDPGSGRAASIAARIEELRQQRDDGRVVQPRRRRPREARPDTRFHVRVDDDQSSHGQESGENSDVVVYEGELLEHSRKRARRSSNAFEHPGDSARDVSGDLSVTSKSEVHSKDKAEDKRAAEGRGNYRHGDQEDWTTREKIVLLRVYQELPTASRSQIAQAHNEKFWAGKPVRSGTALRQKFNKIMGKGERDDLIVRIPTRVSELQEAEDEEERYLETMKG